MLINRLSLRLLTTSSTAATVQVAPRWIAKPIRPAQNAATMKAKLVTTISMDATLRNSAGYGKRSVEGRREATSRTRAVMTSLHVLHHRLGLLVVDDVGDREN